MRQVSLPKAEIEVKDGMMDHNSAQCKAIRAKATWCEEFRVVVAAEDGILHIQAEAPAHSQVMVMKLSDLIKDILE